MGNARAFVVPLSLIFAGTALAQIDRDRLSGFDEADPQNDEPIHFVDGWNWKCGTVNYDRSVADTLASRGADAAPALVRALNAPGYATREGSMAALAKMGGPALACMKTLVYTTAACDPPAPVDDKKREEIDTLVADLPASGIEDALPPPPLRNAAVSVLADMTYDARSIDDRNEALRTLADLLWDADQEVRAIAIETLGQTESHQEVHADALAEVVLRDPSFRRKALESLVDVMGVVDAGSAPATAILFACQDPEVAVRCKAIASLPLLQLPSAHVLAVLSTAAYDADPHVRLEALQALGSTGLQLRDAGPLLLDALQDVDPILQFVALRSLGHLALPSSGTGPDTAFLPRLVPPVLQALHSPDNLVGLRAALLLARASWFDTSLLLASYREGPPERLREIVRILADHGTSGPSRVELLLACSASPDAGLRLDALWRLAQIEPRTEQVQAKLHEATRDADEGVRYWATRALAGEE